MKVSRSITFPLLAAAISSIPGEAQVLVSRFFEVRQDLPDGGEYLDVRPWEQPGATIEEVTAFLVVDPRQPGSGFMGDLYATLRLNDHDAFTVLLNRPGKQTQAGLGYGDRFGLGIEFRDDADDSHQYRQILNGSHSTPLTGRLVGTWSPDGRATDPEDVIPGDNRTAMLSSFIGKPVEGDWQLFLADMSTGGTHSFVNWGVDARMSLANGQTLFLHEGDALSPTQPNQVFSNPVEIRTTGPLDPFSGSANFVPNHDLFDLSGKISGPGGFVKIRAGELVLSNNANDYEGGTLVFEGQLTVQNTSGSATGTGPVAVGFGGTIGGSGRISGPLEISFFGTVSPGASTGTLVVGDTLFGEFGTYHFEINEASGTRGANPGWDHLAINGDLIIDADAVDPFRIQIQSLGLNSEPGLVHDFDPGQAYSWTIASATGVIDGFDPAAFFLDSTDFLNDLDGGSFSISASGSDLNLQYSPAVPEPIATSLFFSGGLFAFYLFRKYSSARRGLNEASRPLQSSKMFYAVLRGENS